MCFTVNVNLIKEELENRYGATLIDPDKYRPSYYYHAYALPSIPSVCSPEPTKIRVLKWGLIPSWTRSPEDADIIRYKTFNARSESIDTKPSFSSSVKSKRCIIPVKGFFEWQHSGKTKTPFYIFHSNNEILSLAGVFDDWVDSSTGELYLLSPLLQLMQMTLWLKFITPLKRMPVILDKQSEEIWIKQSSTLSDALSVLRPYPSDLLQAHTVSPLINDRGADRNTPEVIKPYTYPSGNTLF
ncbi:MAG: SOS response-associated peptidase [Bacteroidales bacterium]|nr:SOS response-associated peptidase [Bacteroidales bacterium]